MLEIQIEVVVEDEGNETIAVYVDLDALIKDDGKLHNAIREELERCYRYRGSWHINTGCDDLMLPVFLAKHGKISLVKLKSCYEDGFDEVEMTNLFFAKSASA